MVAYMLVCACCMCIYTYPFHRLDSTMPKIVLDLTPAQQQALKSAAYADHRSMRSMVMKTLFAAGVIPAPVLPNSRPAPRRELPVDIITEEDLAGMDFDE